MNRTTRRVGVTNNVGTLIRNFVQLIYFKDNKSPAELSDIKALFNKTEFSVAGILCGSLIVDVELIIESERCVTCVL